MSLDRREFLKRSALAAAAAAIGVDSIFGKTIEAGAMQVRDGITWHKSVCRLCGVGCGVM
ncbi:MAG: twin-arginine translocation signal domain-containing protein, partial [Candidatus Doudnabacteria bacterium]